MKKIAIITLAAILVLSSVGVGLAKWFDRVDVEGTITTGSLNLEVVDYSCTYVYKDLDGRYPHKWFVDEAGMIAHKTIVVKDCDPEAALKDMRIDPAHLMPVASATAEAGVNKDEVVVTFENLFPNAAGDVPKIPFIADVVIHYDGTIPAELVISEVAKMGSFFDNGGTLNAVAHWAEPIDGGWRLGEKVDGCTQVHCCNYIKIDFTAEVPQRDEMMSTSGSFAVAIEAQQWDAGCPSPEPNEPPGLPIVPTCTPGPV